MRTEKENLGNKANIILMYKIKGYDEKFDSLLEVLNFIRKDFDNSLFTSEFEEYLNNRYEDIEIAGRIYLTTSECLAQISVSTYSALLDDFVDNIFKDLQDTIGYNDNRIIKYLSNFGYLISHVNDENI